jgi:hypothetical protein
MEIFLLKKASEDIFLWDLKIDLNGVLISNSGSNARP